ncbi:MAG: hypothetical protein JWQ05_2030 [Methylobacterium sp.]|jgi:hypothetical protein|nr:hypothetical protein [Methylobacterium sp.]
MVVESGAGRLPDPLWTDIRSAEDQPKRPVM